MDSYIISYRGGVNQTKSINVSDNLYRMVDFNNKYLDMTGLTSEVKEII